MTSSERRRRFPWVLTLLSAALLAALVALGVWQVQRLVWKADLIARADAAAATPPAPAAEVLAGPDGEFRRVILDCPGLGAAPYVELQSIHEGEAGVRLISACRPAGLDAAFLVDRGFVAQEVSARPPVNPAAADPVRVTAVVRQTPPPNWMSPPPQDGRFFARDPGAMSRALRVDGPVDPRTLFAETSTNPEWAALTPAVPPAAFANNHLGYAITWFGLAVALIVFYGLMLRRTMGRVSSRPRTGQDDD